MTEVVALAIGLAVAVAGVALVAALRGSEPGRPRRVGGQRHMFRRSLPAFALGVGVGALSGWVLAGVATALAVVLRGRLFASGDLARDRERTEAVALWLEGLRDALRGTNLTLEHALLQVAATPPAGLERELDAFRTRWRQGGSLRTALCSLADDVRHPVADSAVAALVFTLDTAGPRAVRTMEQLAAAARQELAARQRVDRIRAQFERAAKGMIAVAVVLVAYLRFVGDLLDPYGDPAGQVFLLVPLGLWTVALWWLRHLAGYERPQRSVVRTAEVAA